MAKSTSSDRQDAPNDTKATLLRAVESNPADVNAWQMLGQFHFQVRQFDESTYCFREIVRLSGRSPESLNDLGIIQWAAGLLPAAEQSLTEAIHRLESYAPAQNNLGMVLAAQGRFREAIDHFGRAIEITPDYVDARLNRAMAWLTLGQFDRGWPEFEWRLERLGPEYSKRRWDGSNLNGETLLVRTEQGLGDILQFVRFIRAAKQTSDARIILKAPRRMIRLLRTMKEIDCLAANEEPDPQFVAQIALMSLPGLLGDRVKQAAEVPYLKSEESLVQEWRRALHRKRDELLVGISWQGDPGYPLDHFRSIPLRSFAPLTRIPGVRLVSLQKGIGTEQLSSFAARSEVLHFKGIDETDGFVDTAAIMRSLDLVVASDSAIVHLAGATATPVWVGLAAVPDWRFMLDREDSPWYPSMRLFRQSNYLDWSTVFSQIASKLEVMVRHGRPCN